MRLVRDKLFINGKEFIPETDTMPKSVASRQRYINDQSANRPVQRPPTNQNRFNRRQDRVQNYNRPPRMSGHPQRQPRPTIFQQQSRNNCSNFSPAAGAEGATQESSTRYKTPMRNNRPLNADDLSQESPSNFNVRTANRFPPWFNNDQPINTSDRQSSLAGKRKPTSPLDSDYSSKSHREYTSDSDKTSAMECNSARDNGPIDNGVTVNNTRL